MGAEISKPNSLDWKSRRLRIHKLSRRSLLATESEYKSDPSSTLLNQKSIQNFVLVWLDEKIDESVQDFQSSLRQLRRIVNSINIFTNAEECFSYINQIKNQKVFMIVSGSIGMTIVSRIESTLQIDSVYIFCKAKAYHEEWAKNVSKIKQVYTDIDAICTSLRSDRQECDRAMIPISYNGLDALFMYTKLLKNIVMNVDDDPKLLVKELVDYCREQGTIDEDQIDEFQSQYFDHRPTWWYTRETFIYSMLNRSLRQMNIEVIQKMGFFIRDLHRDITQLDQEENHDKDKSLFFLYRGQGFSIEAFEKLRQAQGGLMSFNNFLSTSRDSSIALERFARPKSYRSNYFGVLFKMLIDPEICRSSQIAYATMKGDNAYDDQEQEILFTTHTVFRIQNIEPIKDSETQRLFQVDITLVGDEDHEYKKLTASITEETNKRTSPGWSRFGLVLIKLNQSQGAELIYRKLLQNADTPERRAEYLHYLGYAHDIRGDFSNALTYYQEALELRKKSLPEDHLDIASTYNNIGAVYDSQGKSIEALEYHEKSIAIRQKLLPADHPDLANSYNNIAGVHFSLKNFEKALFYYQKSTAIRETSLSENDPDLADSYNNTGIIYKMMNDFTAALQHFEKSLDIRRKSLPANHPDIAVSNNNIANLYKSMGEYSVALKYYEKSIEIWKVVSPDNQYNLAACYNSIGLCHESIGGKAESLNNFKSALAIYEETLPRDHPNIVQTKMNIERIQKQIRDCSIS